MMIRINTVGFDVSPAFQRKIEAAIEHGIKEVFKVWSHMAEHELDRQAAKNIIKAYLDEVD